MDNPVAEDQQVPLVYAGVPIVLSGKVMPVCTGLCGIIGISPKVFVSFGKNVALGLLWLFPVVCNPVVEQVHRYVARFGNAVDDMLIKLHVL